MKCPSEARRLPASPAHVRPEVSFEELLELLACSTQLQHTSVSRSARTSGWLRRLRIVTSGRFAKWRQFPIVDFPFVLRNQSRLEAAVEHVQALFGH